MSTNAVDTATTRNTERLTMFLTEISEADPVDNYFSTHPLWDHLYKKKKIKDGGRQFGLPLVTGANPTVQDFSDADIFLTTVPDTTQFVAYPYVNKGASLVILGEEQRETAGKNHKMYDVVKQRRENIIETVLAGYSTDLFATSQVAKKINSLNTVIDSTGAVGGLNASSQSKWAAIETSSGSFAAQGMKNMRTLWNSLFNNKGNVDTIVTTQDIYEFYENECDPDVRYKSDEKTANRGFEFLTFKNKPVMYDPYATAGVLYMWDSKYTGLYLDKGWNMDFEAFVSPSNSKSSVSKFANRCQFATTNRRTTGKLVTITA